MSESKKYSTHIRCAVITLAVFFTASFSREIVFQWGWYKSFIADLPQVIRWLEQPLRWVLICYAGLYITHRVSLRQALRELGLAAPIGKGLLFGFVVMLPMLIPALFVGTFDREANIKFLIFTSIIWPLGEEILYRGYTFRQLYRRAGWNMWVAALLSGLAFGLVHLYQSAVQDMTIINQVATVMMISVYATVGAWVFVKWDENIWILVSVHGFMNLYWSLFQLAENPLGGWGANVMRIACVVLIIILTIYRKRVESLFHRYITK